MFSNLARNILNRHHAQILISAGLMLILLLSGCAGAGSNINSVSNSAGSKISSIGSQTPAAHQSPIMATSLPQGASTASSGSSQSAGQTSNSNQAAPGTVSTLSAPVGTKIKTVFIIVMENHNWSDIYQSPSAPYINNTLLPQASYATQYFNPPNNHPSEPNYIWLEAGSSLGITNDDGPAKNHQSTTDHLVTYLDKAGVSWKAYQEDITGKVCPLHNSDLYAPKHNPMVFFDDVTGKNDPQNAYCIAHERSYTELPTDLQNKTVAQYNFITPNLCNDMHNSDGCQTSDEVKNGDNWLSQQVPVIMASDAYKQGGAIFIVWDESEDGDNPIGMIVLSPFAKGGGYSNSIHYTHSSTLKTIEEIFNITPFLGDAQNATDLSDLFKQFP